MNLSKLLCVSNTWQPTRWTCIIFFLWFWACQYQVTVLEVVEAYRLAVSILSGSDLIAEADASCVAWQCRQHSWKVEIGLTRFTMVYLCFTLVSAWRDQGMPHQGTGRSRVPDSITWRQGESTMEPRTCHGRVYTRLDSLTLWWQFCFQAWKRHGASEFAIYFFRVSSLQAKFFSSSWPKQWVGANLCSLAQNQSIGCLFTNSNPLWFWVWLYDFWSRSLSIWKAASLRIIKYCIIKYYQVSTTPTTLRAMLVICKDRYSGVGVGRLLWRTQRIEEPHRWGR